jgi:hypothetical protein
MLGVNTIKKLSKKGKLKLQSKLDNVSSHVRLRKVKKIIFLAMMGTIISCVCYTYLPSKRFILAIKSKALKFNSANSNPELVVTHAYSLRNRLTIVFISTLVVALVKSSFIHSYPLMEIFDNTHVTTTASSMDIEDDPFSLMTGIVIFTTIYNALGKIAQSM